MHQLRLVVGHGLHPGEIFRGAALHHVGGQRPGAAGESYQWDGAVQLAANGAHCGHHITEVVLRDDAIQSCQVRLAAHGLAKTRALTLFKVKSQAQRIRHGEDVGKQDRRIHRVTTQWLQRHLAGQFRILAKIQERSGPLARRPVFRQVAAGLAHHPDRCAIYRLAQQGAQESVIFQFIHWGLSPYAAG